MPENRTSKSVDGDETAPRTDGKIVPAHTSKVSRTYTINYPEHFPRKSDPHYRDFQSYRRRTHATAKCNFGVERGGDFTECDGPLELHHHVLEFAVANGVDFELLERDYPGVSDRDKVGAWIESAVNLEWLCLKHHRSHGGVHSASASDWAAEKYVRGLIT